MQDFPTPDSVQSYPSHRRYMLPYHLFAMPVLVLNAVVALRSVIRAPGTDTIFAFVVALALAAGVMSARWMVLRVQDRVIRLEERLRLNRLLGTGRHEEIEGLSLRQLIALRFASDAEVPHLVERVLREELTTPDDIKRGIQHWRADSLRA
jgi:hypothetical protein